MCFRPKAENIVSKQDHFREDARLTEASEIREFDLVGHNDEETGIRIWERYSLYTFYLSVG